MSTVTFETIVRLVADCLRAGGLPDSEWQVFEGEVEDSPSHLGWIVRRHNLVLSWLHVELPSASPMYTIRVYRVDEPEIEELKHAVVEVVYDSADHEWRCLIYPITLPDFDFYTGFDFEFECATGGEAEARAWLTALATSLVTYVQLDLN